MSHSGGDYENWREDDFFKWQLLSSSSQPEAVEMQWIGILFYSQVNQLACYYFMMLARTMILVRGKEICDLRYIKQPDYQHIYVSPPSLSLVLAQTNMWVSK